MRLMYWRIGQMFGGGNFLTGRRAALFPSTRCLPPFYHCFFHPVSAAVLSCGDHKIWGSCHTGITQASPLVILALIPFPPSVKTELCLSVCIPIPMSDSIWRMSGLLSSSWYPLTVVIGRQSSLGVRYTAFGVKHTWHWISTTHQVFSL